MSSTNSLNNRECVKCSDLVPTCPPCYNGSSCVISLLTCQKCPVAFCFGADATPSSGNQVWSGSDNNSPKIIGLIAGLVPGIVCLLIIFAILFRWYIRKHNKKLGTGNKDQNANDWNGNYDDYEHELKEVVGGNKKRNPSQKSNQPSTVYRSRKDSRSIDDYNDESMTIAQTTNTQGIHEHSYNRVSLVDTFDDLESRASNIIAVAYIPGVKVQAEPNLPISIETESNSRSTMHYISSSSTSTADSNDTHFSSSSKNLATSSWPAGKLSVFENIFENDEEHDIREAALNLGPYTSSLWRDAHNQTIVEEPNIQGGSASNGYNLGNVDISPTVATSSRESNINLKIIELEEMIGIEETATNEIERGQSRFKQRINIEDNLMQERGDQNGDDIMLEIDLDTKSD